MNYLLQAGQEVSVYLDQKQTHLEKGIIVGRDYHDGKFHYYVMFNEYRYDGGFSVKIFPAERIFRK